MARDPQDEERLLRSRLRVLAERSGLPLPALERARDELLDFQGSGMSIMEHSHRGKEYEAVHNEAIALLTGLHAPDASHLLLLEAVAGRALVDEAYARAAAGGYLWHEFGDTMLFLP